MSGATPTRFRVLLAEPLDAEAEERLAAAVEVVRPEVASEAAIVAAIGACDALIARTHTHVTREIIRAGTRLRVIGVAGVGTERVDLAAAAERGITVLSTPAAASDAVAELTVGFMIELLRPIGRMAAEYRRGRFAEVREAAHGRELRELTVGIIGMGRIGSRVGRICSAGIGARVIYHDILPVGPFLFSAAAVGREELLAEADVITLHVPLTAETTRMIDASALARVKAGAYLVNTARGRVVDTAALVAALKEHRLAGAALDVVDPEPLPQNHALFSMPNVIVTPHIAARTVGGLRRMFGIVEDVVAYLQSMPRP